MDTGRSGKDTWIMKEFICDECGGKGFPVDDQGHHIIHICKTVVWVDPDLSIKIEVIES